MVKAEHLVGGALIAGAVATAIYWKEIQAAWERAWGGGGQPPSCPTGQVWDPATGKCVSTGGGPEPTVRALLGGNGGKGEWFQHDQDMYLDYQFTCVTLTNTFPVPVMYTYLAKDGIYLGGDILEVGASRKLCGPVRITDARVATGANAANGNGGRSAANGATDNGGTSVDASKKGSLLAPQPPLVVEVDAGPIIAAFSPKSLDVTVTLTGASGTARVERAVFVGGTRYRATFRGAPLDHYSGHVAIFGNGPKGLFRCLQPYRVDHDGRPRPPVPTDPRSCSAGPSVGLPVRPQPPQNGLSVQKAKAALAYGRPGSGVI